MSTYLFVQSESATKANYMFRDLELLPTSSDELQNIYQRICDVAGAKRMNSKKVPLAVFRRKTHEGELYYVRGHYEQKDEQGRHMAFMGLMEEQHKLSTAEVLVRMQQISKEHGFSMDEKEIQLSSEDKKPWRKGRCAVVAFIVFCVVVFCIGLYYGL